MAKDRYSMRWLWRRKLGVARERLYFAKLGMKGQLGNQLFQIASTIGIARANDMDAVFPEWAYGGAFEKILPRASLKDETLPIYREENFTYRPVSLKSSHIIEGYFQSEMYFRSYREEILSQFRLRGEYRSEVERLFGLYGYPDCSMHVRRGDYIGHDLFVDLSRGSYYERALAQLSPGTKILCFSDDPAWCRTRFLDRRIVFAERSKDVIDLFLFSRCRVNIIANSSYSWWGAWLNCHPDSVVFAPRLWFAGEFADKTQPFRSIPDQNRGFHDTSGLIPSSWKRLDCA
jgi:Glycosyl transferase family 11